MSQPGVRPTLCVVLPAHWEAIMGGSQYQAKLLIEYLSRHRDCDIYYLARKTRPGYVGTDHTVVRLRGVPRLRRFAQVLNAPSLWHALRRIRPDVIYQRVGSAYTGICAHYARHHGARMVWHVASDMDVVPPVGRPTLNTLHTHVERRLCEYGIRQAHCIITQTQTQRELLLRNYGRSADAVIANFHPEPTERICKEGQIRIVWIANLKRIKRPELFCRLARDLAHREDVRFLMIGAEPDDGDLKASMREELSRTPNVEYLGQLSQAMVNRHLANAHVLVNTSVLEGFSNTFIQAWQRGVPVLSLDANPDGLLDDGVLGGSANGDYGQLVRLTERLISDPARLARMSAACQRHAAETHSMRNVARVADQLFRSPCDLPASGATGSRPTRGPHAHDG